MAGLLGTCTVLVVLFCLTRSLVPSLRPPGHRLALDAWHVLMGAAMTAMLLAPLPRALSVVALGVFVAGLAAATVQAVARPGLRAAYARVGVGCVAMAAMLTPAATASAAGTASGPAETAGMPEMAGMDMSAHGHAMTASTNTAGLVPPTLLLAALAALLGGLLVVRLVVVLRRGAALQARLDACCDVAMAAAMGYMLLLMV
ncbi:MAG: hypothetical protein JWO76_2059 [Nocardioides sp.]|nr:hypothetical protein [Nocardioides sp.]